MYKTIVIVLVTCSVRFAAGTGLNESEKSIDKIYTEVDRAKSIINLWDYWFTGLKFNETSPTKLCNDEIDKQVEETESISDGSSISSNMFDSNEESKTTTSSNGESSMSSGSEDLEKVSDLPTFDGNFSCLNGTVEAADEIESSISNGENVSSRVKLTRFRKIEIESSESDSTVTPASSETFVSAKSSLSSSNEYVTKTEHPNVDSKSHESETDNAKSLLDMDNFWLEGIEMIDKNKLTTESLIPTQIPRGEQPTNFTDKRAIIINVDLNAGEEISANVEDEHVVWLDTPNYMRNDNFRLLGKDAERAMITSRTYDFVNLNVELQMEIEHLINYIESNKYEYEITDEEIVLDQMKDRDVEYKIDMCANLVDDNAILRNMGVTFDRTANANDIHSAVATIHLSIDNNLEMYATVIGCPTVREASGEFSWLYFLPIRYENCAIDDYTFVFDRIKRKDGDLHLRLTFLSKIIFENIIVEKTKPKTTKRFFRKLCNCFLCRD